MPFWKSYTFDPRQFATQPGGVFPHETFTVSGQYHVDYGLSDKSGLQLPPAVIQRAGPFTVTVGKNYTCLFLKPGRVVFSEGASNLYTVYPDRATIYVRNEMTTDVFLGVRIGL